LQGCRLPSISQSCNLSILQSCNPAIGRRAVVAAVLLLLSGGPGDLVAQSRRPTIAAASSLNFALTEVAARFAQDGGERVELVFGASGTLSRQIRDGAPFELFLAADEDFPGQLSQAGLTRDAGVVYAIGRLAIFAPRGSPLVVDEQLQGLTRFLDGGGSGRFAIANPEVAPYGKAAEAVLRKRGLWDRLRPSLVMGDSISQAAQFATSGNTIGGLLAYSLVLSPEFNDRGTYALVPEADYPPLRQRMVMLKRAGPLTERFYQYLQGSTAREILRKQGFALP
jgi:molybdate transport system substrate-binding protein